MSSIKTSRRSPRLMEKEASNKIAKILLDAGIPLYWVFDDALFQKRCEYEELLAWQENALGHCACRSECYADFDEERKEASKDLPNRYFPEEDVKPVLKELVLLGNSTTRNDLKVVYITALMRFLHGPARIFLRHNKLREMIQEKCNEFTAIAMSGGLTDNDFWRRMVNACCAVDALIAQKNDPDGYDIFHN